MLEKVYVFDQDVAIREMLWKIFKARGYRVYCYPLAGACPETFFAKLDCNSGHACGKFILSCIDFHDFPRLELIKRQVIKKCCKVQNIGLMSTSWSASEQALATGLGCETFQKPLREDDLSSWVDACEKKTIHLRENSISMPGVLSP
jgi:hypothetical protein